MIAKNRRNVDRGTSSRACSCMVHEGPHEPHAILNMKSGCDPSPEAAMPDAVVMFDKIDPAV